MQPKHTIKKLILGISMDSANGSYTMQTKLGEIFKNDILPVIDVCLNELAGGNEIYKIEKLEIDLGKIRKRFFKSDFINKLHRLLTEKFKKQLRKQWICTNTSHRQNLIQAQDENRKLDKFEILQYFFKNGYLPPQDRLNHIYHVPLILENEIHIHPLRVKKILQENSKNESIITRFIFNTTKTSFYSTLALFAGNNATSLCSLVEELEHSLRNSESINISGPNGLMFILRSILLQSCLDIGEKNTDYQNTYIDTIVNKFFSRLEYTNKKDYRFLLITNALQKEQTRLSTVFQALKMLLKRLNTNSLTKNTSLFVSELPNILIPALKKIESGIKEIQKLTGKMKTENFFKLERILELKIEVEKRVIYLGKNITKLEEIVNKLCNRVTDSAEETNSENIQAVNEIAQAINIIEDTIKNTRLPRVITPPEKKNIFQVDGKMYVRYAGIILVWPYLTEFFKLLNLVESNGFKDETGKERAVSILQFLATDKEEGYEYENRLTRILCGMNPEAVTVLPQIEISLTAIEKMEGEKLLLAVIRNWPALNDCSVTRLREMFLNREGILYQRESNWFLRIEEKAQDLLLSALPWEICTIKLPWMQKPIFIEWRQQ